MGQNEWVTVLSVLLIAGPWALALIWFVVRGGADLDEEEQR